MYDYVKQKYALGLKVSLSKITHILKVDYDYDDGCTLVDMSSKN